MLSRELQAPIQPVTVDFGDDLHAWLRDKAVAYDLRWLLAHADDGVNWGVMVDHQLVLSSDHFPAYAPPLRVETLQQARLFGPTGELYLWRDDNGWQGRFLAGAADDEDEDTFAGHYLLWGDQWGAAVDAAQSGPFLLLADGVEGLRHAPPQLTGPEFTPGQQYLALRVQHYVAYDEDGQAHIAASRLVQLDVVARAEEHD